YEMLNLLRNAHPGKICANPVDIEARTLSGISAADTEISFSGRNGATTGFICRTKDQCKNKPCKDYRVRFSCHPPFCSSICWTKWFDLDNPSGTGDWELLINLHAAFPGQIPNSPNYIQAVTTNNNVPALSTGQVIHVFNPTFGFACRKKDQPNGICKDYKVRFGTKCSDQQSDFLITKGN
uniref:WxxW domain-containing protein n=2 Tax=Takifugu rubripes TaxID=31033 RepID=A0A674MBH1_TAKRU